MLAAERGLVTVYLGTHDGLYRAPAGPFESAERVLDCGTVHAVRPAPGGVLAATDGGLYRRRDGDWHDAGVPRAPVTAVAVAPDGGHCYAGTYPARIYRRPVADWTAPLADAWQASDSFRALPDRDRWAARSPRTEGAQVRALAVAESDPDRLLAGVEVGGVVESPDRGTTWTDRSTGVHDDVHHLLVRGGDPPTVVASCGNGLYQTPLPGQRWHRLDTDFREFWYNYHREAVEYRGQLYTSANGWGPAEDVGAVVTYDETGGATRRSFPEDEGAFIISWALGDDRLLAGTMYAREGFEQTTPAPVLAFDGEDWSGLGTAPAGIKSLLVR